MQPENVGISVILPVYQNDLVEQLSLAIGSILEQTLQPSEFIIVIDGPISQDLHELINDHVHKGNVRKIQISENKGLAHALNVGISEARYPLIARMDADDISLPERFEIQVKLLLESELDLIGGQIIEFGADTSDIKSKRIVPTQHEEIVKFMKLRSPFSHSTILFRKSLYDKVGGYSERFKIEDYEFFVRCHQQHAKFGNTNEVVLFYRVGRAYETFKRRKGPKYARNEINLYLHFYKLGFYNYADFFKSLILKLPLRFLPFPIFLRLYMKAAR